MTRHAPVSVDEQCARRPFCINLVLKLPILLNKKTLGGAAKLSHIFLTGSSRNEDKIDPIGQLGLPFVDLRQKRSTRLACRSNKQEQNRLSFANDLLEVHHLASKVRQLKVRKKRSDRQAVRRIAGFISFHRAAFRRNYFEYLEPSHDLRLLIQNALEHQQNSRDPERKHEAKNHFRRVDPAIGETRALAFRSLSDKKNSRDRKDGVADKAFYADRFVMQ